MLSHVGHLREAESYWNMYSFFNQMLNRRVQYVGGSIEPEGTVGKGSMT